MFRYGKQSVLLQFCQHSQFCLGTYEIPRPFYCRIARKTLENKPFPQHYFKLLLNKKLLTIPFTLISLHCHTSEVGRSVIFHNVHYRKYKLFGNFVWNLSDKGLITTWSGVRVGQGICAAFGISGTCGYAGAVK